MSEQPPKNILSFEQKGKDVKALQSISDKTEQIMDDMSAFLFLTNERPAGSGEEEKQKLDRITDLIELSLLDIQNAHDTEKAFDHWKNEYRKIINYVAQFTENNSFFESVILQYQSLTHDQLNDVLKNFSDTSATLPQTVEQTIEKQEHAMQRFNSTMTHEIDEYIKNKPAYEEKSVQHLSTRFAIACLNFFLDTQNASDDARNMLHINLTHYVGESAEHLPEGFIQQLPVIINHAIDTYNKSNDLGS